MKKLSFALLSDVLFFMLCAFLIGFTLIRYYFKNAIIALILAALLAAAAGLSAFLILTSRRQKKRLFNLGEAEKKSLALHLSVCNKGSLLNTFKKALDGTYVAGNTLESEDIRYYFNFRLSPVSPDEIAEIIRDETGKHKKLLCNAASAEAISLAEDFDIEVELISSVYSTLKDRNLLPEKYALGKVKKRGFFSRVKRRFNKKISPSLFTCGLALLFFSFFTFFPIYYIVSGSLLLAASAASVLIKA